MLLALALLPFPACSTSNLLPISFPLELNADLSFPHPIRYFSLSDMNHSNMYAVGLALCTFANISSEEMSRDLCNEIEKLLGSSNTYIRKKVRPPFLASSSLSPLLR